MSSIKDEVKINATPEKAYAALTTQQGYLGWWSKDCQIADAIGGESSLKFNKGGSIVKMRFRTDVMDKGAKVKWTCIAHDMDSWVGTTLSWSIAKDGAGVRVALSHDGWKSETPPDMVAQGWKHFLGSMKQYLETGSGQPW
jgi:uncharacterized protein YndB with AHSA1/START domain